MMNFLNRDREIGQPQKLNGLSGNGLTSTLSRHLRPSEQKYANGKNPTEDTGERHLCLSFGGLL